MDMKASKQMTENAAQRMVYIDEQISRSHPVMDKLREVTSKHSRAMMISDRNCTVMLSNIIKFAGAKKCIEVGVFTGYSSLAWALSMPDDGKLIACDVSSEFTDVGKPFWKEAGVDHKIDLRIAPAAETLKSMVDAGESGTHDFVYIDADKEGYDTYYELALKLIRAGGMIAIDNVYWRGKCMDANDNSSQTVAIRQLNEKIRKDDRVTAVMMNAGDGIHVVVKK